jgi:3-oxoacyl-(acyl-carrier-protein) synthase
LDHINTHATSTPAGDLCEARAIFRLLKEKKELLDKVSVTANKSAIGHTFGAAGGIESIFTILALKHVSYSVNLLLKFRE